MTSLPQVGELQWASLRDDRRGVTLEHPEGWKVQRGSGGLVVALVAPVAPDGFAPNLNVVRRVNDKNVDLDELAKLATREILRLLTDVTLVDAEATVVAGNPARRLLFSYRQGIYGLTGEQWIFLTPEHVWTITAGTETGGYDGWADVFSRIVGSLEMTDDVH